MLLVESREAVEMAEGHNRCSGRDLNPRRRLERPACLAGLHHRSSGPGGIRTLDLRLRTPPPYPG